MMTNPYIWNTAIKLPLSSGWDGSLGALGGVGYFGGFWSPVVGDDFERSYNAVALYVGGVRPVYTAPRGGGFPVRCVAR